MTETSTARTTEVDLDWDARHPACPACGQALRRTLEGRLRGRPVYTCPACATLWVPEGFTDPPPLSLRAILAGLMTHPLLLGCLAVVVAWTVASSIWFARSVECQVPLFTPCPAALPAEPWPQSPLADIIVWLAATLAIAVAPFRMARRSTRRVLPAVLAPVALVVATIAGAAGSELLVDLTYPDVYRPDAWWGIVVAGLGLTVVPLAGLLSALIGGSRAP